jgi:glycosyltransferase involved in cell wall biosynthesis
MDVPALAEAIVGCLKNPDRLMKMAHDADTIAQRLSWKGIAKRTVAVYESLIGKKNHKITPESI